MFWSRETEGGQLAGRGGYPRCTCYGGTSARTVAAVAAGPHQETAVTAGVKETTQVIKSPKNGTEMRDLLQLEGGGGHNVRHLFHGSGE